MSDLHMPEGDLVFREIRNCGIQIHGSVVGFYHCRGKSNAEAKEETCHSERLRKLSLHIEAILLNNTIRFLNVIMASSNNS